MLLLGETGTGKELFATQIHERSTRHARAMVRVNCAAIPSTLIESELFGREKGAFTGALARQIGRFEIADHSTIFLDEIGDLPSKCRSSCCACWRSGRSSGSGARRAIRVDTRIIAATHRDLEQRMAAGTFREDLFYRLNVFPIRVPAAARARRRHSAARLAFRRGVREGVRQAHRIDREDNMAALQRLFMARQHPRAPQRRRARDDHGNRHTVDDSVAADAGRVRAQHQTGDVERSTFAACWRAPSWRIRGVGGAADRLGLKPTTLETRLAKLGLKRPAASV